jgi:cell division protein FtsB
MVDRLRRRGAREWLGVEPTDSDARPGGGPPRGDESAGEPDAPRRLRRHAGRVTLALVFVAGAILAGVGEGGLRDRLALGREVEALQQQRARKAERVGELSTAVQSLEQDPTAMERVAREQLDYLLPGEVVFVLPPDPEVPWEEATP